MAAGALVDAEGRESREIASSDVVVSLRLPLDLAFDFDLPNIVSGDSAIAGSRLDCLGLEVVSSPPTKGSRESRKEEREGLVEGGRSGWSPSTSTVASARLSSVKRIERVEEDELLFSTSSIESTGRG